MEAVQLPVGGITQFVVGGNLSRAASRSHRRGADPECGRMGGGESITENGGLSEGGRTDSGGWGFVESVLAQAEEDLERKYRLKAKGFDFEKVVNRVAELLGLQRAEVLAAGKYKKVIAARSLVCFWAVRELGISQIHLARRLGISQPAVSMAVSRGEQLAKDHNFSIIYE